MTRGEPTAPPMETPRLLVVADLAYAGSAERLLDVVRALAPALADPRVAVQLRANDLDAGELERLAQDVRACAPAGAALVLNGSAEIASGLGYAGVHWPEHLLPAERPYLPRWQSAAAHSAHAVLRAETHGMDAAVFGAVYPPRSHPGHGSGMEALRDAANITRLPVIAIGGITPENTRGCIDAGAYGVAVVSTILDAPDPAGAAREYLDAIEAARKEGIR